MLPVYLKLSGPGGAGGRCLVFLYLLLALPLAAQDNRYMDSLRHVIATAPGSARYDATVALLRAVVAHDLQAALVLADSAQSIAVSLRDSARIVESGRIRGQLFVRLDESAKAIEVLEKVLPVAKRQQYKKDYRLILDNLAIAYSMVSDFEKSLSINLQSLDIKELDKDSMQIGFTLNNIGLLYYRMDNHEEALKHYLRSYAIRSKLKQRDDMAVLFSNIGFCYNALREFDKAFTYFSLSLNECGGNCPENTKMVAGMGIGTALTSRGDFKQARPYLDSTLVLAKNLRNNRFYAEALYGLSRIYTSEGKLDKALAATRQAEEILLESDNKELLMGVYFQTAEIYGLLNEYRKAADYLKKHVLLNKQVYDEKFVGKVSKLKTSYEQREHLATIKSRELTILQQRQVNIYITVVAGLSVLLVVVMIRAYRTTRKINRKLSDAQKLILEQNNMLEVKNRDLDNKVEKKTEELKLVNLSLKEMNHEVDNFIHRTSQDIRAPLASLKGICNVAMMDLKDSATVEYLEKISQTTEVLSSTLQRLIVINKISNARLKFARINFGQLLDELEEKLLKGDLPFNLTLRRKVNDEVNLYADKEVLSLLVENTLERIIRQARLHPAAAIFAELRIENAKFGRVQLSIVDNCNAVRGGHNKKFGMFNEEDGVEKDDYDLYFVKTAATKLGGKAEWGRTSDGFNEMSILLSAEPLDLSGRKNAIQPHRIS